MKKNAADDLLRRLEQIEEMLRVPMRLGHSATPTALALSIVRQAPTPEVANLAMQLSVDIEALEPADLPLPAGNVPINKLIWRLRRALDQAKRSA